MSYSSFTVKFVPLICSKKRSWISFAIYDTEIASNQVIVAEIPKTLHCFEKSKLDYVLTDANVGLQPVHYAWKTEQLHVQLAQINIGIGMQHASIV